MRRWVWSSLLMPPSSASSSSADEAWILTVLTRSMTADARCEAAASRRETGERPLAWAKFFEAVMKLLAVAETLVRSLVFGEERGSVSDGASSLTSWQMSRMAAMTIFMWSRMAGGSSMRAIRNTSSMAIWNLVTWMSFTKPSSWVKAPPLVY